MAVYILHYILFSVTRITNLHLLLDESFQIIWGSRNFQSNSRISEKEFNYNSEINRTIEPTQQTNIAYQDIIPVDIQKNRRKYDDQEAFFYTHLILFASAILALLIGSLNTLNRADKAKKHRAHLLRAIGFSIVLSLLYLYTMNTLASGGQQATTILKLIHTLIVVCLLVGYQWSHAVINSLFDCLTVHFCIKQSNAIGGVHYHYLTHLIVAAFSAAMMSTTMCEIYLSLEANQTMVRYTNVSLLMIITALLTEFGCLKLFTTDNNEFAMGKTYPEGKFMTSERASESNRIGWKMWLFPKTILNINNGRPGSTKAIYSLSDNTKQHRDYHSNIWSLSAVNLMLSNETMRAADEEECNNSVELFYIYSPGFYNQNTNTELIKQNNKINNPLYDRSKFSLYEDYNLADKELHRRAQINSSSSSSSTQSNQLGLDTNERCGEKTMSTFQILFISDWSFIKQVGLLVLIGTIHQANQLCFFTDYLRFLVEKSPAEFRGSLINLVHAATTRDKFSTYDEDINASQIIWIELMCACLLVQSLARAICLHYINTLVFKLGSKTTLLVLAIISLSIPVQFVFNYAFVRDFTYLRLSSQTRVLLAMIQQVIIQIQIGSISALSEFIINDLSLYYTQHVVNYKSSKLAKSDLIQDEEETSQSTVHGILSGSFNLMGTAVMSAAILLIRFFLLQNNSTLAEFSISIGPSLTILVLLGYLFATRWTLIATKRFSD